MDTKEILNEIDIAYTMISKVPEFCLLNGEAVDAIAVARTNLRKAYAQIEEADKKPNKKRKAVESNEE